MLSMMRQSHLAAALGLVAVAVTGGLAQEPRDTVADLIQTAAVKAALAAAKANEPQAIDDQIHFCEIPAPSFKETARGAELRRTFQELGLQNVRIDAAGNVLGDRPGAAPRPRVVIAAHLDTVFPEGTDVHVKREGAMLYGPGIGDDCRGLGVLVATIRSLKQANVQTPGSITFVADVGEEGLAICAA
jgi:tripeptide aminopeptidase